MTAIDLPHPAPPGDASRSANPSRILTLVHHHGKLSRAQLTRLTGLNRSTVSVLVGQLAAAGLVYEAAASGESQVGRPSPDVHANPAVAALAVNTEIDAVTIGLVGLGGQVLKKIRYATERIPTASEAVNIAAAVIAGMRSELEARYKIVGLGVAVPGLVTTVDGMVRLAPHLGWEDEPLARMFTQATGYPATVANDASLAAEAEMVFGAATGLRNLIYLNGGASGIGGGIITEGRLLTGVSGYAGEFGHTFVAANGRRCHCGALGCLETEVSQAPLLEMAGLDGGEPGELAGALRTAPGMEAMAEVRRQLGHLGTALRNIVNIFNPEAIVLNGFLAALLAAAPGELQDNLRAESMRGPGAEVRLSPAVLGSDLMMVGAAELAFSGLLADPLGHAEGN
ncbi:ROK family transcriptional regulator [Arthrobacter sp. 35W]|uniref:ROK family transcriptional regulator n=1 Tax=Arthrobacter sp. 35W TaxID=1132441 RepID=UPI000404335D|nr:ROK family transcriptional regulator [Arthrobacter sp. 35W]